MFFWKPNPSFGVDDDELLGNIFEDRKEKRVIGVFHYQDLGYRIFGIRQIPIAIPHFLWLINDFVAACDLPELPKDRATIVAMDLHGREGYRDTTIALPLEIVDGRFTGYPTESITCLRLDVPEPMPKSPPTRVSVRAGETVKVGTIGPRGVWGLSFFYATHSQTGERWSTLAIADPWQPVEQVVDFWQGVNERNLNEKDRASLKQALLDSW